MTDPGLGAFATACGLTRPVMADGRGVCEVDLGPQHLNPHGIVHGAVIYALADTAMGAAVTSRLSDDERCATLEIKINYLAPATSGRLTAESVVVGRSRRIAVVEARVRDADGGLVALATGSFYVSRRA